MTIDPDRPIIREIEKHREDLEELADSDLPARRLAQAMLDTADAILAGREP